MWWHENSNSKNIFFFFYFLRENVEFVISSIMYLSFWLLLSIDVSNLKKEPQNVKYCQPSVFLPTCPNPKSSGSWLHFLHWMMIFLCVRLETAYLWTLWSHWQKATDWRFFWPRSFDCSWVVPAVSQLKLGAFFAQDPFKAFFCSQSLSFSLSGLQKLLSVFPKGFFAQEHFQLIDKCRQQRKTYNTDFFF